MNDTNDRKSAEMREQNRPAARTAPPVASEAAQRSGTAAEQESRHSADALRQGRHAAALTAAGSGEAGAETMQHFGKVAEGAPRQGAQLIAEGQQQLMQRAAGQWEHTGQALAEAVQATASDMRTFMMLPQAIGGSLQELQQGMSGLVEGVIQANLNAMQDLFRLTETSAVIQVQRQFMHSYMNTLLQGSVTLAHSVRSAADRTLRPLEQQLERRRNGHTDAQRQDRQGGCIGDVMQRDVRVANPNDTVQQVARVMREEDTGVLPVGEGDRLVGMVTDRDVTVRLVAEGRDPAHTKVREVMTPEIRYVFEDEDLGIVAETMAEQQVRRLPVLNRAKRMVGVISLSDLARDGRTPKLAGQALGRIAEEGGRHTQAAAE